MLRPTRQASPVAILVVILTIFASTNAKWFPVCAPHECPPAANVISCSSRSCNVLGALNSTAMEPQILQSATLKSWDPAAIGKSCPDVPFSLLSSHPRNVFAAIVNDGNSLTTTIALNKGEQTEFECLHTFPGSTVDMVPVNHGARSGFLLLVLSLDLATTPHTLITVPLDGSKPTTRPLPSMESLPARITAASNGVLFLLAHTTPQSVDRLAADLVEGCLRRDQLHCTPTHGMHPDVLARLNMMRTEGTRRGPKTERVNTAYRTRVHSEAAHSRTESALSLPVIVPSHKATSNTDRDGHAFELWSSEDSGLTWGVVTRSDSLTLTSIDCTQGDDSLLCVGGGVSYGQAVLAYSRNSGFSWKIALTLPDPGAVVSDVAIAPEGAFAVAVGAAEGGNATVWTTDADATKWSVAASMDEAEPFVSLTMTADRLLGHALSPQRGDATMIYGFGVAND